MVNYPRGLPRITREIAVGIEATIMECCSTIRLARKHHVVWQCGIEDKILVLAAQRTFRTHPDHAAARTLSSQQQCSARCIPRSSHMMRVTASDSTCRIEAGLLPTSEAVQVDPAKEHFRRVWPSPRSQPPSRLRLVLDAPCPEVCRASTLSDRVAGLTKSTYQKASKRPPQCGPLTSRHSRQLAAR